MHRIVGAVNESLYYQMLCKGLLRSLVKYQSQSSRLTLLLDGENAPPLDDLRPHFELIRVKPLDFVCGCVLSRTTFACLEIPELFPNEDRILYLDVDTFLLNNIDDLFSVPFTTLAAVVPGQTLMIRDLLKREFQTKLKRLNYQLDGTEYGCGAEDHKYFNAGSSPLTDKMIYGEPVDSHCRSDVDRSTQMASITHQRTCSRVSPIASIRDVHQR